MKAWRHLCMHGVLQTGHWQNSCVCLHLLSEANHNTNGGWGGMALPTFVTCHGTPDYSRPQWCKGHTSVHLFPHIQWNLPLLVFRNHLYSTTHFLWPHFRGKFTLLSTTNYWGGIFQYWGGHIIQSSFIESGGGRGGTFHYTVLTRCQWRNVHCCSLISGQS
jgi:hypothetical protein